MATSSGWTVLVFGDSWADYMHPCWPAILGQRINARVLNFAAAGSMCGDLPNQGQTALMNQQVPKTSDGLLSDRVLVVVHTCGNDFLQKVVEGMFGGSMAGQTPEIMKPNPGVREAKTLTSFMKLMHKGGARNFLISGVPVFLKMPVFNLAWPIVSALVNQGKLSELGVSPGDPPQLAMEVQALALQDRWEEMIADFKREHSDSQCVFFDEVGALENLREKVLGQSTFDRSMWDFSQFHPSQYGHEQLADQAYLCVKKHWPQFDPNAPSVTPAASTKPSQAVSDSAPAARQQPSVATTEGAEDNPKSEVSSATTVDNPTQVPMQAIASESATERWTCSVCTLFNDLSNLTCEACDAVRPPGLCAPPRISSSAKAEVAKQVEEEEEQLLKPFNLNVRNVKGDVSFTVRADTEWSIERLRKAIMKEVPDGFPPSGSKLLLVFKGNILSSGSLGVCGLRDGEKLILAVAPAKKDAAPSSTTPAAKKAFQPPART